MTTRQITAGQVREWLKEEDRKGNIVVKNDGEVFHTYEKNPGRNIANVAFVFDWMQMSNYTAEDVLVTIEKDAKTGETWLN